MRVTRRTLLPAAAAAAGLSACATAPPLIRSAVKSEAEIRAVLAAQAEAWNAGDVDGFMRGYWRSPTLRFASGATVTRGFDETLARYQQRYPDRAAMGRLSFTDLEIDVLGPDGAVVFGRWKLERAEDAPQGVFTLMFRRIEGLWLIVADHTS